MCKLYDFTLQAFQNLQNNLIIMCNMFLLMKKKKKKKKCITIVSSVSNKNQETSYLNPNLGKNLNFMRVDSVMKNLTNHLLAN